MKNIFTAFLLSFLSFTGTAQSNSMEEFMYSSGKINVVISVILIILLFIFIYLIRLDKKVKRLEDDDS
ncbi:MAG: CcmD family protein [Flavobacteriales bacterium]|nr:CcmD family protein [Flavobacteriales bacterium]